MDNTAHLYAMANAYLTALEGKPNAFVLVKPSLSFQAARTSCSTFLSKLIRQSFDLPRILFPAIFFEARARDFATACERTITPVTKWQDIRPGTIGAVRYDELRMGMSGHCWIVAGPARLIGNHGELSVRELPIIDSCRSSHGPGDTRYSIRSGVPHEAGGIGRGVMRLLTQGSAVKGYSWSLQPGSEYMHNGLGQTVVFGAIPETWSTKEIPNG